MRDEAISFLEAYLPSINHLLAPFPRDLEELRDRYEARKELTIEATRMRGGLYAQDVIFNLWWRANEGNQDPKALLDFIDHTVASLLSLIPMAMYSQVRTLCKHMLFNFDDQTSEYTRRLAELAVIEYLVRRAQMKLEHIEYKLPNGKSVDFLVSQKRAEGLRVELLFEVYMIDFDIEKIKSSDDLRTFIDKRLVDKINKKLTGVDPKAIPQFAVLPVLRGNVKQLISFEEGISWLPINIVAAPYVLTLRNEKGRLKYYFLKAKELFDQVRRDGI
jgi:hypothetical protein